jgi:hypothetical protein
MRHLAGVLVIFFSLSSFACKCISNDGLVNRLKRHDLVFEGKILRIDTMENSITCTFQVVKTWKGKKRTHQKIVIPKDPAACGFQVEKGITYLIFSKENFTNACSYNSVVSKENTDWKALKKIK